MAKIKYLVKGGYVLSRNDGDRHYVGAGQVIELYGVDPRECKVVKSWSELNFYRRKYGEDVKVLRPNSAGNYKLP